VLEKFLPHLLYLSRGEVLVALALADLDTVDDAREQVDAVLRLTAYPVDLARGHRRFRVEEITAEILERVLVQLVERG
jgi:hypothetical protein